MRNPLNSLLNQNAEVFMVINNMQVIEEYLAEAGSFNDPDLFAEKMRTMDMASVFKNHMNDLRRIAGHWRSSSKMLHYYISNILDFSRIRQNKFRPKITRFDIVEAI